MARKKAASELKPWLSANPDNKEKRFAQVGHSFCINQAVKSLSPAALKMYICIVDEAGADRTFEFPEGAAKKYGFTTKGTFRTKVQELIDAGFIEVVENNRTCRKANVYRFSLKWKGIDSS